jgi:hypothetical protein
MQNSRQNKNPGFTIPNGDPTPVLKSMHERLIERTMGNLVDTLKVAPIDHAPRFVPKRGSSHGKTHAFGAKIQVRSSF